LELNKIPEIAKYLSAVFLVAWIGRSTVWNFLPIYFEREIASVFLVGILTSLPSAIPVLIDIPVGNLVQRLGEKAVIFTGLAISILPGFMYLTAIPILLGLGKAFEGITKSMVWIGGWSLSLTSSDDEVESETVSVFLLGVNMALILGPIIGGYLISAYGFQVPLYLWIISATLSLAVFTTYIGISTRQNVVETVEKLFERRTYHDDWKHIKSNWTNLRLPLTLIFLYSIIFSFFWLAIPLLLDKLGADFITMGLIFGAAALPKAFQYIFGDIADKYGKIKLITTLSILLAIVLAAMSQLQGIFAIAGAFLIARLFVAGMSPPIHALYDSRAPDDLEGELTGFFELSKHTGQALGPTLAGFISSVWSLKASFLMASIISILLLIITLKTK
jgi:Arabinose efflux permease